MSSNINNDQADNNNTQSENGATRPRHLTNIQLAQQVNQFANTVNHIHNEQQAFQQQLLAQLGQNMNAAIAAQMQNLQQNTPHQQAPPTANGQSAVRPHVGQAVNHMMKPPKLDNSISMRQ